ncbi:hypothetical protein RY831_25715 [Noviherbaspirillum sp. CPCC 100848]|uniref:Uncharacterized protein n=1 Tax=Noviherbaspirillum album TaxID=3080276 RepID=A0ABU6JFW9_9BURK|nr:hypothetical protein [Noviherbaspirillum sp. CPCC 100848]MEC4722569.1 hypothetical protein [Noviherbaspirillum sp. CPCC 100848]
MQKRQTGEDAAARLAGPLRIYVGSVFGWIATLLDSGVKSVSGHRSRASGKGRDMYTSAGLDAVVLPQCGHSIMPEGKPCEKLLLKCSTS